MRRRANLHVTLHVDPLTIHSWSVLCGLSMLANDGSISLDVRDLGYDDEPYTLMLEVKDHQRHSPVQVSLAVGDAGRDSFTRRESLADIVFRRSSSIGDNSRPLGMLLGVESGKEPISRYLLSTFSRAIRRRSMSGARRTVSALARGRFPTVEEYELNSASRGTGGVFFQPRAWDPAEGDPNDREMINEYRAELIRALRSEFGPGFTGGFVASEFARARYPELLFTGSSERSDYLARIRQSDIGIASIGLHRSTPFKIPEYLAAGRAVLSEPLYFQVGPDPDGAIGSFTSVSDCVEQVSTLLSNRDQLIQRQEAALVYWRDHVRPDRIMARMIRTVQQTFNTDLPE